MPLTPGQILNNRYRIVKLLGQGGFGAVYRAWDLNLKVACALKENLDTTEIAQRQFAHEATILASLHHLNLPRVTDHFIIPDQGQYLVMDFIEGDNLEELLAKSGTPVREDQVQDWISQICGALTYLHNQQPPIIHRDIKPANIKITPDGRAVLVDFGIAKIYDPHLKTTAGARAITPGYSPPEQYGFGKTDPRSDIYALGATLYKAITRRDPPESVERAIGTALTLPRQVNPQVSDKLESVVLRAMEMTPTGRFQSAADMKAALYGMPVQVTAPVATSLVHPALVSPATPQGITPASPIRKQKLPIWLGVGLAGILGLGVLIAVGIILVLNNSNNLRATQTAAALARLETRTAEAADEETLDVTSTSDTGADDTLQPSSPVPVITATSPPVGLTATLQPTIATPTAAPFLPTDTPTSSSSPLQPLITDSHGVPMVLIPSGSFVMGGDPDIGYQTCLALYTNHTDECVRRYFEDADTLHTVYLDDYYLDRYEVTNHRYADCVAAGACSAPFRSRSITRDDYYNNSTYSDYPVIYVNWDQAQAYCTWRGGRLPTEAEWERAARQDDGRIFPWGWDFDASRLNFCDSSCSALPSIDWFNPDYNDGYADTSPVGSYGRMPGPYELYDIAGNVWEWLYDWYGRDYYDSSPSENPMGPDIGEVRVVRGGSIANTGYVTLTYYRDVDDPTAAYYNVGIRCVLTP